MVSKVSNSQYHDLFELKYRDDDSVGAIRALSAVQHCLVLREETRDMRDRGRRRESCVCLACFLRVS